MASIWGGGSNLKRIKLQLWSWKPVHRYFVTLPQMPWTWFLRAQHLQWEDVVNNNFLSTAGCCAGTGGMDRDRAHIKEGVTALAGHSRSCIKASECETSLGSFHWNCHWACSSVFFLLGVCAQFQHDSHGRKLQGICGWGNRFAVGIRLQAS